MFIDFTRVFTIFAIIGAFIVSWFLQDKVFWAVFSLFSFFGIQRVLDMWEQKLLKASIDDKYEQVKDIISEKADEIGQGLARRLNVERFSHSDAVVKIPADLDGAIHVKNTSFDTGTYSTYDPDLESAIISSYVKFLSNRNCMWSDVVGIPELFGERYREIHRVLSETSTFPLAHQHWIGVLSHTSHTMNFIIIDYPHPKRSVVYFGWINGPNKPTGGVFRSDNDGIVEMFDGLYDSFIRTGLLDKTRVDYKRPGNSMFYELKTVNKAGLWYTLAFEDNKLARVAAFEIVFSEGDPLIQGWIVEIEDADKGDFVTIKAEHIDHRHENIVYRGSEMYINFEFGKPPTQRAGLCKYTFDTKGGVDIIFGFYVDNISSGQIEIFGIKVPDDNAIVDVSRVGVLDTEFRRYVEELREGMRYQTRPIVRSNQ